MPEMNLNSTILAAAWQRGSTDFQQLVPPPSQSNMREVIEAFNMPNAGKLFQEVTGLFTTIGITRIKSNRWENPLSFLEDSYMSYGASTREIAFKWAKAHCYASDVQTLLKRNYLPAVEAFARINRLDRYDASFGRAEYIQSLQPGIGGDDGTGLDSMLGAIFDSMYSPEAYDSMNYTLQVIAEADRAWGLMRENVPEITSKETGETFMQKIEELALQWRFPSTVYNNVDGLPVWTNTDDLCLFVEPRTLAAIDFKTLANLFHSERGEDIRRRVVVVPLFNIPNVRAILCDRNFFNIHRSLFSLESFYNPQQMVTNYYLQSQGIWAASPLPNIVLLGDFDSTVIPTIEVAPTTLVLTPFATEVELGGSVQIRAQLNGTVTATPAGESTGNIMVKPDACVWTIEAPAGVTLNRRTFVDRFGVLHVQKTGIDAGTQLTVKATSTYINPSGETPELTAQTVITVIEPVCHDDSTEENMLGYTDIRNAVLADDAIDHTDDPEPPVNP